MIMLCKLCVILSLWLPNAFAFKAKQAVKPVSQQSTKQCLENTAYDRGFNEANEGKELSTPEFTDCPATVREKLIASFRRGYKEAAAVHAKGSIVKGHGEITPLVFENPSDPDYLTTRTKCSDYKKSSESCLTSFEGEKRGECEVCRENKSCFVSLNGRSQILCSAYREKKTCFVAMSAKLDRAWCEHFREGKSCEDAFRFGTAEERTRCEQGEIPKDHYFWMN